MQRGQVSLELVVVIIVAATAVFALALLMQVGVDSQKTILVQNQAKALAHSVSKSVAGLAILQESASGTTVSIPTEPITVFNPTFLEKCTVEVIGGTVRVQLDWKGNGFNLDEGDIEISRPTVVPNGFSFSSLVNCGNPLTATRT